MLCRGPALLNLTFHASSVRVPAEVTMRLMLLGLSVLWLGCGAPPVASAPEGSAVVASVAVAPEPVAAPEVAPSPLPGHPALLDPAQAKETAPADYQVRFETTKGNFVVSVHKGWASNGANRLYNLVKIGYFTDVAFFRAIDGFMGQFGLHGNPAVNAAWREASIPDDSVKMPNKRGTLSFATSGPNSRTTQLFINFVDNGSKLDSMGFSPIGEVTEGQEVVDSLYKGYGEGGPRGKGPYQGRIHAEGNEYLRREFPKLDWIKSASLVE